MKKFFNWLRGRAVGIHRDDRGVVSVLAVLTVWCMVALLGMLFNEVEESRRKAQMQAAADAAAYSASVWMARTSNQAVAYNMSLAQDVSMEAIWAAIAGTDQGLHDRMEWELHQIDELEQHPIESNRTPVNVLEAWATLAYIAGSTGQANMALAGLESGDGANYANAAEKQAYENRYRQARLALNWSWYTYVKANPGIKSGVTVTVPGGEPGGNPVAAPGAPALPPGPGPDGQGLMWLLGFDVLGDRGHPGSDLQILEIIRKYIQEVELGQVVPLFEAQFQDLVNVDLASKIAGHEDELYRNCLEELAEVPGRAPGHANEVREQLQQQFNVDLTYANLDNVHGHDGPAEVIVPFMPASDVPSISHVDTIRTKYFDQLPAGMSPNVEIDPMNPQTDAALVWHPGLLLEVDPALRNQYGLKASYRVGANFPLGWGHLYAWPIERYARQRAAIDKVEIDERYLSTLDTLRNGWSPGDLRYEMGALAGNGYIPEAIMELPATLPDDQPRPGTTDVFDTFALFPQVDAPAQASPEFRKRASDFNAWAGRLADALRQLRMDLIDDLPASRYEPFLERFASKLWAQQVNTSLEATLAKVGREKKFVVLRSAALREIPQWAQVPIYSDAVNALESQLVSFGAPELKDTIFKSMVENDPLGFGAGIQDQAYLNFHLNKMYQQPAADAAAKILRPPAHQVAMEIAGELISRPWPYEISLPTDGNLSLPRGILPTERKKLYTVVAAARENAGSHPRTILPAFFRPSRTALIAFAQAETFNWMEFNDEYGAGDNLVGVRTLPGTIYRLPTGIYNEVIPIPSAWRAATTGGWQYRARLSLADALTYDPDDKSMNIFDKNDELREYFESAGITPTDTGVPHDINLH